MRFLCACVFCLVLPAAALADGLATRVCVLEKSRFDNLIKSAEGISKVPNGDLWAASVGTGHLVGKPPNRFVSFEFSWQGKRFKLHATGLVGKTLYAIVDITDKKNEKLVASGMILAGQESAENTDGEPFCVVVRSGNFLQH